MSDQDRLFYLSKIAKALDSTKPKEALMESFTEIIEEGMRPQFAEGLLNFKILIDQASLLTQSPNPFLLIERPDGTTLRVTLESGIETVVEDLPPGAYSIRLWNGRLIWEGLLTEDETVRSDKEDLRLAASVEPGVEVPTRIIHPLGREITIRIFSGFETGMARVQWNKK